jgi:hypothetical protein
MAPIRVGSLRGESPANSPLNGYTIAMHFYSIGKRKSSPEPGMIVQGAKVG